MINSCPPFSPPIVMLKYTSGFSWSRRAGRVLGAAISTIRASELIARRPVSSYHAGSVVWRLVVKVKGGVTAASSSTAAQVEAHICALPESHSRIKACGRCTLASKSQQ